MLAPRRFFENNFECFEVLNHVRVHFGNSGRDGGANDVDGERCLLFSLAGNINMQRIGLDQISAICGRGEPLGARSTTHG